MIDVAVMFSTTGPYATIGCEMRDGALLAIDEINRYAHYDFNLRPIILNPEGKLEKYFDLATELLSGRRVRHIIGCYTSSSRKEIIPAVEKYDALLWYPSHYEGFESCDCVVYGGATPNQHLLPLARWALSRYGRHIYCIGSNYVWSWGNNRIIRELVQGAGGQIVGERYLPIGSTDVESIVKDIASKAPDAVFCTLIGNSSYEFYKAYRELSRNFPAFSADRRPILSCSLSEPELTRIGAAAEGHISSSVYFQSLPNIENVEFVETFHHAYGAARSTSADAEASYVSIRMLADGIHRAGTARTSDVKRALYGKEISAPQGAVKVEQQTNHTYLTPRIGRARGDGQFSIVWQADEPLRPDPYLSGLDIAQFAGSLANGSQRQWIRCIDA